ncbi:MAG: hypothetical protein ACRD21_14690, partial [Vicinamibacteria bacterium]
MTSITPAASRVGRFARGFRRIESLGGGDDYENGLLLVDSTEIVPAPFASKLNGSLSPGSVGSSRSGRTTMPHRFILVAAVFWSASAFAQRTSLLEDQALEAIVAETSGALALSHFRELLAYSGFAPSKGSEDTAAYIADRARAWGLEDVRIEEFPSDGETFFWSFRSEPWWEGKRGELRLLDAETGESTERLASFGVHRIVLGRFSRSATTETDLVDVGSGVRPEDYAGKDVRGKIVLASGPPGAVHARAVWEHGAQGVVVYRTQDHVERPELIGSAVIEPFLGPNGEPPGFLFSLSYRTGKALSERLRAGEKLRARAEVDAESRAGHYSQVHAVLRGTEPALPEVWIQAHTNHRNTGGGNNLTGLGATLDLARSLSTLVSAGR